MLVSTVSTVRPSVWIGCLACYNSGALTGEWVPAEEAGELTPEDIHGEATTHEELWCFDLEGFPAEVGEMSLKTASLWGELFTEVSESLWEPFLAWAENGSHIVDINNMPDFSSFEDRYRGWWPSFSEYLAEDIELLQYGWPETAIRYFDEESYERDARYDYDVIDAPDGGVFVFANF